MAKKGKTKRDILYKTLKKEINSGYLMPGTRLVEMDVAARHEVSRTIVREVLKQLTTEGLVELVPYKGANVAKTSIRDLEESYRIQQDLEGLAAYLATPSLSKRHISELEKIHRHSKKHSTGDVAEWQRLNMQFHAVFVKNCGNKRLVSLIESLRDQFARYWFLMLSIPGRVEQSTKEHEKILAAVNDGKPARVRSLMEKHFESGAKRLLEIIKNVYPSSFHL